MRSKATLAMLFAAAIALLLQACSRPLSPQESCGFVQNPELQRVSWKDHLPVKLFLHKSVPKDAFETIDRAIGEFNTTQGREIFKIISRGVDGDLNPQKDGYSTIYWFNTWDPARTTEQARTTIYWSGTEIFEADMRINAKNFSYNFTDTTAFVNVDLHSLLVHELGHVLGLAHTTAAGSAMHATLDEGQVRRKLGAVDLTDLKCEY